MELHRPADHATVRPDDRLYRPLSPRRSGLLQVSDLHAVYFEESGNPDGKPVVVLHGGPGAGTNPMMRRFHDPERYRIVLFDQRGCGRSQPYAELAENTTWDLVADMEKLRRHLGIERWQLFGGSWGSTLALAYAESHPERVSDLVLRGIFLVRRAEIDWFYRNGAGVLFPDAFEDFLEPLAPAERDDPVPAYYRILTGCDRAARERAAQAWSAWEAATLSLLPSPTRIAAFTVPKYAVAFARIECHYFVNEGFIDPARDLIGNAGRIAHLPAVIVNGRYDVVTPMRTAWQLHRALPKSELVVVADAGHAMTEAGIVDALVAATDRFAANG